MESWNEELGSSSRADENLAALERRKVTLNAKAKEYQGELEKLKVGPVILPIYAWCIQCQLGANDRRT